MLKEKVSSPELRSRFRSIAFVTHAAISYNAKFVYGLGGIIGWLEVQTTKANWGTASS